MTRADELATLYVRQQAEKIMATLPPEPEWATEQRCRDMVNDANRLALKQRRMRKLRGVS